jgi:LPS-assembly lipoprotein
MRAASVARVASLARVARAASLARVARAARVALLAAALALAGCGFKLRGQQTFPFDSIYLPPNNPLTTELARNVVAGSNAKLATVAADAEAQFLLLGEVQEKVILALNTQGQVREYQLRYRVVFRVGSPKGVDFLPTSQIQLTRDITFNDQVLAKESEEAQLYRDMRRDMVQLIMRRLAAARPLAPEPED